MISIYSGELSEMISTEMRNYFYDWLDIEQEFEFELPIVGKNARISFDTETGEMGKYPRGYPHQHQGSYSTSIRITTDGNRLRVSGNPSRFNRIENLFGYTSLAECVAVYNAVLQRLGLPSFTTCTTVRQVWDERTKRYRKIADGAVIREVHVTANQSVGQGNEQTFIKALSTQPLANSIGHLYTNQQSVDWRSAKGNASLVYSTVYCKAFELETHALTKAKSRGDEIATHKLLRVIRYCQLYGVIRRESKIKSRKLRREGLQYYGLDKNLATAARINGNKKQTSQDNAIKGIHTQLMKVGEKLKVDHMDIQTIAQTLITENIVDSTRSANTTAFYAHLWMHGQPIDLAKSQAKTHRARLRKIGIDIGRPCDITRISPVIVKHVEEITIKELPIPDWYDLPKAA